MGVGECVWLVRLACIIHGQVELCVHGLIGPCMDSPIDLNCFVERPLKQFWSCFQLFLGRFVAYSDLQHGAYVISASKMVTIS